MFGVSVCVSMCYCDDILCGAVCLVCKLMFIQVSWDDGFHVREHQPLKHIVTIGVRAIRQ